MIGKLSFANELNNRIKKKRKINLTNCELCQKYNKMNRNINDLENKLLKVNSNDKFMIKFIKNKIESNKNDEYHYLKNFNDTIKKLNKLKKNKKIIRDLLELANKQSIIFLA